MATGKNFREVRHGSQWQSSVDNCAKIRKQVVRVASFQKGLDLQKGLVLLFVFTIFHGGLPGNAASNLCIFRAVIGAILAIAAKC